MPDDIPKPLPIAVVVMPRATRWFEKKAPSIAPLESVAKASRPANIMRPRRDGGGGGGGLAETRRLGLAIRFEA